MGCTYCGVTLLWALLVWATWSAECYPIATSVAPAGFVFTRPMFLKFSVLYCYLTLCLNLFLFGKKMHLSVLYFREWLL